jgi:hypothetical protein
VLLGFFQEVGGELFIKNPSSEIDGPWIILMDGVYYDENGVLNDVRSHGRDISFDDLDRYIPTDPITIAQYRSKFERVKSAYFSYTKIAWMSILNQLEKILGYTEIKVPFADHEGRIYLIRYNGEMRIMRLFGRIRNCFA